MARDGWKIRKDIPQSGWQWVDVTDRGSRTHICQACVVARVRHVHRITHSEFPTPLLAGCLCAGRLTGDGLFVKGEENKLVREYKKRQKFLTQGWSRSLRGEPWASRSHGGRSYWLTPAPDGTWLVSMVADRKNVVLLSGQATRDEAATALYKHLVETGLL
jgi:hypothetical protein